MKVSATPIGLEDIPDILQLARSWNTMQLSCGKMGVCTSYIARRDSDISHMGHLWPEMWRTHTQSCNEMRPMRVLRLSQRAIEEMQMATSMQHAALISMSALQMP